MIRCDTEEERQSLSDLVWAVKDLLIEGHGHKHRKCMKEVRVAFDRLGDICLSERVTL